VGVRADDHVDLALHLLGQLGVHGPDREVSRDAPVAEMRETDDELGSTSAQLPGSLPHRVHLVEGIDAVVDRAAVEEAEEGIGDSDEADSVDERGGLDALDGERFASSSG
jgi:hypothetical protein